ncbi:MAG: RagB/SusD family nutrient uptake outer membrane protein, partial [Tannerellaceae bacterium]
MKITKYILVATILSGYSLAFTACNDNLDIAPPSSITPENYLWDEAQLEAFTVNRYGNNLPVVDPFCSDGATDIQAGMGVPGKFTNTEWKVGATGGAWGFEELYNINYFINTVVPRHAQGKITGNPEMINHYIGEMYLFRALQHFGKLKSIGDAPIVKTNYPDDKAMLIEVSKRMPRTEVARFIIADLDSAIYLMKDNAPDGNRNRLSKPVALLVKSRVALYEGTWLKYFKDTPYVPNGP